MVTSKSEKMNAKNRERELVKKTQKNKAEEKFNLGLLNDNGHENIEPPLENAAIQSTKKGWTKVEINKYKWYCWLESKLKLKIYLEVNSTRIPRPKSYLRSCKENNLEYSFKILLRILEFFMLDLGSLRT